MRYLFIGDSFTEGQNNSGKGYAHYMNEYIDGEVLIDGISGTTVGSYSIYPVNRYSLLSRLDRIDYKVSLADVIVLEFGINDISAVTAGNATYRQVLLAFISAIDAIRQLNPKASLYILHLGGDDVIRAASRFNACYMNREYFSKYPVRVTERKWARLYRRLVRDLCSFSLWPVRMFRNAEEYTQHMDVDRLHPNAAGYKIVARNVVPCIASTWCDAGRFI